MPAKKKTASGLENHLLASGLENHLLASGKKEDIMNVLKKIAVMVMPMLHVKGSKRGGNIFDDIAHVASVVSPVASLVGLGKKKKSGKTTKKKAPPKKSAKAKRDELSKQLVEMDILTGPRNTNTLDGSGKKRRGRPRKMKGGAIPFADSPFDE